MIRSIHERQYVRGRELVLPFGVGESWSSDSEIDVWLVSASPRWIVEAGAVSLGVPKQNVIAIDAPVTGGRRRRRYARDGPS